MRHNRGITALTVLVLLAPQALPVWGGPIVPRLDIQSDTLAPESGKKATGGKRIEELDKALACIQRRSYAQALTLLQTACKNHPHLPPARLMLARALLASKKLAAARALLDQAATDAAEYPGVYTALGKLALAEGRRVDALVHFEKAETLARSGGWRENQKQFFLVQSFAGRASIAASRKDWPTAQKFLKDWLALEPKNGQARTRLAEGAFALGKPDEAYSQLKQAVKDDATLSPAAVTMAWLATGQGDLKKAASWMASAIQEEPDNARAHLEFARWLVEQGRAEEAKTQAEVAVRLGLDSRELQSVRGWIAWQLQQYADAERFFDSLYQQAPGDFLSSNPLVLTLIEQTAEDKRSRALQLAEINARLYPDSADALAALAWVYYRLGSADEAEQMARAARARGKGSSDTAYYLARILFEANSPDEAKKLLKTALEATGHFAFRKQAQEWFERLAKK